MRALREARRGAGMRLVGKVLAATLVVAGGGLLALREFPPPLLRIGSNYAAEIVCSNLYLAGRDPQAVLRTDVQAPGSPFLRLMRVTVDRRDHLVRAGVAGFIGNGLALETPGHGCTVIPDGHWRAFLARSGGAGTAPAASGAASGADGTAPSGDPLWPDGDQAVVDPRLQSIVDDPTLAGPGLRAIVVVHRGRIVAERYGHGFGPSTPLLGWSMTKSVFAGLVGVLVGEGRLSLDASAGLGRFPGDPRAAIRIADLLSMTDGLRFNERYGSVSDVTRMLFLEPDMAAYAASQPLAHPVGRFWSYSSGAAMILARIVQRAAGPHPRAFAREHLFAPIGIRSATIESDEQGTLVGSSYLYATARDWARYAELLRRDGVWNGVRVLPAGFVAAMIRPVDASDGQYGAGMIWRFAGSPSAPGVDPDRPFGIPSDAFWMEGYDGQWIAIVPSRALVVLRMGLTPSRMHYQPQRLVGALLEALNTR